MIKENLIIEKIRQNEIRTISDYFAIDKEISNIQKGELPEKKVKIALLSSFTLKGVKEVLNVECFRLGIGTDFYSGNYNQYSQEILDKNSNLYKFNPDLVIISVDLKSLMGDLFFIPYSVSNEERKRIIDSKLTQINSLLETLCKNTSAKIIFHNFEVPCYSPLGVIENKQSFGFIESVRLLNSKLEEKWKENNQIFIFDYDSFCSRMGKVRITDTKMYYLADMRVDINLIPELSRSYLAYIKPLSATAKKCIVLDLDNTLWGGVLGEEGIEGIKLGPTPEGRSFWEFQKSILSLFNKGVILAINSKNNLEEVMRVFKEHPYMVLKEEHFASMQINWQDKISNMKRIAEEINIGMDSLVFMDDDKVNREVMRKALPEVKVVDIPEDTSLYLKTLESIDDFNSLELTEEDLRRGYMYATQRKRKEFMSAATDISKFLKGLGTEIRIKEADSFSIPRISQLTQKTNQFNMTTKRYSEEDMKKFLANPYLVLSFDICDKFGDNGITGVMIIKKEKTEWFIDTFLLSCRILGRGVEDALISYIAKLAKKEKMMKITGEFIPTKKNEPAKGFYEKKGFKLKSRKDNIELWELDLKEKIKSPEYIKITEN